jgi:hypothetical protein
VGDYCPLHCAELVRGASRTSMGLTVITLSEGSARMALHSIGMNAMNRTIVSVVSFMRRLAGLCNSMVVSPLKTSVLPRGYRWTRNFLSLLPTFSVPRFP